MSPTVKVPDLQVLPPSPLLRSTGLVLVVDETTDLGGVTLLSKDTVGWRSRFLQTTEVTVVVPVGPRQVRVKFRQVTAQVRVPEERDHIPTPVPTLP